MLRPRENDKNNTNAEKNTMENKNNSINYDLLGVSVHHFVHVFLPQVVAQPEFSVDTKFLNLENLAVASQDSKIGFVRRKGLDKTCPLDGRPGCAYVHALLQKDDSEDYVVEDHVGPSTAMLSWTWQYSVGDVVATLQDYCQCHNLNPKRTYIWMCCLCVNQHRVVESLLQNGSQETAATTQEAKTTCPMNTIDPQQSLVDFETEFRRRVLGIGKVLAMMGPWEDPAYLKRVWCIFEMFTALNSGDKCEIIIVMPPRERERMSHMLLGSSTIGMSSTNTSNTKDSKNNNHHHPATGVGGGVDALYQALSQIDVEHAQATMEEDRTRIMTILRQSQFGIQQVNQNVGNFLRQWVREAIDVLVKEEEERMTEHILLYQHGSSGHQQSTSSSHGSVSNSRYKHRTSDKSQASSTSLPSTASDSTSLGKRGSERTQQQDSLGLRECQKQMEEMKVDFLLDTNKKLACETAAPVPKPLLMPTTSHGSQTSNASSRRNSNSSKRRISRCRQTHAAFCTNVAMLFQRNGEYDAAIEMFQKSLTIYETEFGTLHLFTAATYSNLGSVWMAKGQHDKALQMHRKSLDIQETLLEETKQSTEDSKSQEQNQHQHQQKHLLATTYNKMGHVFQGKGDFEGGLVYQRRALEMYEDAYGHKHPACAPIYSSLGSLLLLLGKHDQAQEQFEIALQIFEQSRECGGRNLDCTAKTCSDLGRIFHAKAQYKLAMDHYEKALKIQEKVLGQDHIDTAITFLNQAKTLQAQGRLAEALQIYKKSLEIFRKTVGWSNPSAASALCSLGSLYQAQKDYQSAEKSLRQAMKYYEANFGDHHYSTARVMSELGSVYHDKGDYDAALSMLCHAAKIQETAFLKKGRASGTTQTSLRHHPSLATTYLHLGRVKKALNQPDEAHEFFQKCLAIQKQVLGKDHPTTASTYSCIGSLLAGEDSFPKKREGLKYFQKCVAIQEEKLGAEHPLTMKTKRKMRLLQKDLKGC